MSWGFCPALPLTVGSDPRGGGVHTEGYVHQSNAVAVGSVVTHATAIGTDTYLLSLDT